MPLSNDFDKGRLKYLKMQIKNNETVNQQFYPRFQRAYNELFPFTESSAQNVLQPQQQIINNALPRPTDESVETSFKEKLYGLTKNQTVTDYIYGHLETEQQYYYEKNFDMIITKELLKKVKIPTSQDEFLLNLNMILNVELYKGYEII